jgi:hypothetical protein
MCSRQKSGMSGTTRPQTRWEVMEKVLTTSPPTLIDALEHSPFYRLASSRVWGEARGRRKWGRFYRLLVGPGIMVAHWSMSERQLSLQAAVRAGLCAGI